MNSDNWKTNLGNYLGESQIFRTEYLNTNLVGFCKEWVTFVKQFDGIESTYGEDVLPLELRHSIDAKYYFIVVSMKDMYNEWYPFKMSLYYTSNMEMVTHSSLEADMQKMVDNLNSQQDVFRILQKEFEPDFYTWTTERHNGIEIHEIGYVCQVINIKFKAWIDKQKKAKEIQ